VGERITGVYEHSQPECRGRCCPGERQPLSIVCGTLREGGGFRDQMEIIVLTQSYKKKKGGVDRIRKRLSVHVEKNLCLFINSLKHLKK
jgi:hypothetical protein